MESNNTFKSICIICSLYPNAVTPASQVFVQQFVWTLADSGVDCTVICPMAINLHPSLMKLPYSTMEKTDKGNVIKLYFPKFISFGQQNVFGVKTARLTTSTFYRSILRTWNKLKVKPDAIYGHFLTPAGITAARIGRRYSIPSFAAYGESSPWSIFNYGIAEIKKEISNLNGIVSVSTANKLDLLELGIIEPSKISVFPNGIRLNHYYQRDREQARTKFGFEKDVFIVAFLGQFSDRKGILRLAEAAKGLENVRLGFAGSGSQDPVTDNIIYKGTVNPLDVPDFLSAADIFVLPTLNEGCCNAIIEAMGCGLPIVSSNLPFNHDILDENNAILIDPQSISEIRNAIIKLRDDSVLRESMAVASLNKVKSLTIDVRTQNIKSWLKNTTKYT